MMHSIVYYITTLLLIQTYTVAFIATTTPFSAASRFLQEEKEECFSTFRSTTGKYSRCKSHNKFVDENILSTTTLATKPTMPQSNIPANTRRSFLNNVSSLSLTAATIAAINANAFFPQPAFAANEQDGEGNNVKSVQTPLYYILRVREATEQETRLIKSGKFKDVQRANVKLAVKFMVDNYRLNDNFIAASAFLTGERRIKAGDIGQTVVQNLITILEYFDASDVENIKVGATGLGGKETIVLNGLQAARKGIDEFVSLFPKEDILVVISRIEEENILNEKEFDKELNQGSGILNPKPTQS